MCSSVLISFADVERFLYIQLNHLPLPGCLSASYRLFVRYVIRRTKGNEVKEAQLCREETRTNIPTSRNEKQNTLRKVTASAAFRKKRRNDGHGPPSTPCITAVRSLEAVATASRKIKSRREKAAVKAEAVNLRL